MSDEELYAECDVVDFIEADAEKRAQLLEEFVPTGGPESEALHIITPYKGNTQSPNTSSFMAGFSADEK